MFILSLQFLSVCYCLVFDLQGEHMLVLNEEIIEHQIVQGYFKPMSAHGRYSAVISDEKNDKIFFHSENLNHNEETHFSFNTVEPINIVYRIRVDDVSKEKDVKNELLVDFKSECKFDTFNKEVAKDQKIAPAMQTLMSLEKLLQEVHTNTLLRKNKFNQVAVHHKKLIFSVVFLSFATLILFVAGNVYQVMVFKKFLKKKKYI